MSRSSLFATTALTLLLAGTVEAQEPEPGAEDTEAESAEGAGETPPGQPAPEKKRPKIVEPEDEDGPEPPLVVPAPNLLAGHFQLSPSIGYYVPFASVEASAPQSDVMSSGPGFGLEAAYGLSRTVALGAWGQMLSLGDGDSCKDCETSSTAFGLFVRYHLVQGTRFDPWMSAGAGYRITKIETPGQDDVTYSGIEWVRVVVGGDWYPFDVVGFGPYLELDMGRYSSRSKGEMGDSANHWHFGTGIRVTLDLPGK